MWRHLLLVKHQLDKLTSEAVLRIVRSPSYGEIIKPQVERWKSKRKQKKNRKASPLEKHTDIFERRYGKTTTIERLQPFSAPPDWIPPKVMIHRTKKDAKDLAERALNSGQTMIYTDGSGINKKVGAAAISPHLGSMLCVFLGSSTWYTIYSAELHGIVQALILIIDY